MKYLIAGIVSVAVMVGMMALTSLSACAATHPNALDIQYNAWSPTGNKEASSTSGAVAANQNVGGTITYSRWATEKIRWNVSVGIIATQGSAEVTTSNTSELSSIIVPILVGLRYYPLNGKFIQTPFMPYVSVSGGPYLGYAAEGGADATGAQVQVSVQQETLWGFDLGAGIDWEMGQFKLNLGGKTRMLGDFANAIGGRKNYSGSEFSGGFGFTW